MYARGSLLLAPFLFLSAYAPQGGNTPPIASTGGNSEGNYVVDCNNSLVGGTLVTSVQLDGSKSYDPDGTPVTFYWHNECQYGAFDDPYSPTPVYHVDMQKVCERDCWVALRVTSGGQTTAVGFQVFVEDVTPPTLSAVDDYLGIWGDSTEWERTGGPTPSDNCDFAPTLTYTDVVIPATGPGQPELTMQRTWTVTDCKELSTFVVQTIRLLAPTGAPGYRANLDYEPNFCPNVFELAEPGSFEINLLGGVSFKAEKVIPSTLRVWVNEAPGIAVIPNRVQLMDVGSITATAYGECNSTKVDGRRDLRLRFNRTDFGQQFDLGRFQDQSIEIMVTGNMTSGKLFATRDFIAVQ